MNKEDKIQLTNIENSESLKVHFENGKYLGMMIKDVDGYYYFEMDKVGQGLWDSHSLLLLSKTLDHLNEEDE
jgi:hypothetical protein